eukprot:1511581-Rhodomonas_salina.1
MYLLQENHNAAFKPCPNPFILQPHLLVDVCHGKRLAMDSTRSALVDHVHRRDGAEGGESSRTFICLPPPLYGLPTPAKCT